MVKGGACVVKGGVRGKRGCVWRGVHTWRRDVHGRGMRGRIGGHCSGRYASYWNASLYWNKSDIASRWAHRESNLMFTLSNDKDQTKNPVLRSLSFSVNEP